MSEVEVVSEASLDACGLTRIVTRPLERVPLCRRESTAITSAWRLALTCDQGEGSIVPVEGSAAETLYRGDGMFLGWPQERLSEVYRTLTRPPDDGGATDLELPQLG